MTNKLSRLLAAVATLVASSLPASAVLLVYEGFDYTGEISEGGTFMGSSNSGTGFSSGYSQEVNGAAWTYSTSSLSFSSNYATTGGSAVVNSTTASAKNIYRPLSADLTGTTYGSYLFTTRDRGADGILSVLLGSSSDRAAQATVDIAGNARFVENIDPRPTIPGARFNGDDESSTVTYADGGLDPAPAATEPGATTYMILWKTVLEASSQSVSAWVLTGDQYDYFYTNGFTESALDSATVGTAASEVTATITSSGTGALESLETLHLFVYQVQDSTIDEVRIGTEFSDAVAIPEPSTMAILFGGLAGLLAFLRKRLS
jgi:hypothetical protein